MPYSVDITGFSGGTPPITFYVCDQYGNNCSVLGTTTGVYVLPALFQTGNIIMIKSVDSTDCTLFTIFECVTETCYILTENDFAITSENGDNLTFCD